MAPRLFRSKLRLPAVEAEEGEVERLLLMDELSSGSRGAGAEPRRRRGGGPADGSPRQTSTGNQGQEILSTQPADTISQHQQIQIQEKENEVSWCGGSECINPVQVLAVLAGAWPTGPARSHRPH